MVRKVICDRCGESCEDEPYRSGRIDLRVEPTYRSGFPIVMDLDLCYPCCRDFQELLDAFTGTGSNP